MTEVKRDDLREIYKGGNGITPGKYYYFSDTRKPVPYQTKKVNGKQVYDPEFESKYLHLFKVVNKPEHRQPRSSGASFDSIRSEEPQIIKSTNFEDIVSLASGCGWRLSQKAVRALRVWGKSTEELTAYLNNLKIKHNDCNYLDYDPRYNQFLTKFKSIN